MRRLQLLVREGQYRRLQAPASERNVTVAALVRDAVDAALPPDTDAHRAAADRVLTAPRMHVGDPGELRSAIGELRGRHA